VIFSQKERNKAVQSDVCQTYYQHREAETTYIILKLNDVILSNRLEK